MNCTLYERNVGHLVAGELDVSTSVAMEDHEASCVHCRTRLAFEKTARSLVQSVGQQPAAPSHLRARIMEQLPVEAFPAPAGSPANDRGLRAWHALPLAVAAIALMGLVPLLAPSIAPGGAAPPPAQAGIFRDAIRLHTSALPSDIEPTAPNAVRRYFRDKVRFRVRPARFQHDAQLVGARLSHLGSRRAAALYYRVQGQRLTVMIVDHQGSALHSGATPWTRGPNALYYRTVGGHVIPIRQQHGLTYLFAGDLARSEMLQLAASANVGD